MLKTENMKVGIVGGTGSMGVWFRDLLEKQGAEVVPVGRSTPVSPEEAARTCRVVVISVPVKDTIRVIRELGPLVSEDGLLMDLTSIKQEPVEAMMAYSRAEVVGAHPLFGPKAASDPDARVVLCPGRGGKGLEWLKSVFQQADYRTTVISAEEHDRLMGLVQGVNHFSMLAMALCISQSGYSLDEIKRCSTITFKNRLDRAGAIMTQPMGLFASLLMDNPHSDVFLDRFIDSATELKNIVRDKDLGGFEEAFKELRAYFGIQS